MKKIEIGTEFPRHFQSLYPEEFSLFSHLETASSIPSVLFAITTWKENGRPNICFHAWSSFCGEPGSFYAVLGNLYQHTHTYANILRERCFGLSFLPLSAYAQLVETITQEGFMFLVPAPQDLQSGKADRSAIATLRIKKVD